MQMFHMTILPGQAEILFLSWYKSFNVKRLCRKQTVAELQTQKQQCRCDWHRSVHEKMRAAEWHNVDTDEISILEYGQTCFGSNMLMSTEGRRGWLFLCRSLSHQTLQSVKPQMPGKEWDDDCPSSHRWEHQVISKRQTNFSWHFSKPLWACGCAGDGSIQDSLTT